MLLLLLTVGLKKAVTQQKRLSTKSDTYNCAKERPEIFGKKDGYISLLHSRTKQIAQFEKMWFKTRISDTEPLPNIIVVNAGQVDRKEVKCRKKHS